MKNFSMVLASNPAQRREEAALNAKLKIGLALAIFAIAVGVWESAASGFLFPQTAEAQTVGFAAENKRNPHYRDHCLYRANRNVMTGRDDSKDAPQDAHQSLWFINNAHTAIPDIIERHGNGGFKATLRLACLPSHMVFFIQSGEGTWLLGDLDVWKKEEGGKHFQIIKYSKTYDADRASDGLSFLIELNVKPDSLRETDSTNPPPALDPDEAYSLVVQYTMGQQLGSNDADNPGGEADLLEIVRVDTFEGGAIWTQMHNAMQVDTIGRNISSGGFSGASESGCNMFSQTGPTPDECLPTAAGRGGHNKPEILARPIIKSSATSQTKDGDHFYPQNEHFVIELVFNRPVNVVLSDDPVKNDAHHQGRPFVAIKNFYWSPKDYRIAELANFFSKAQEECRAPLLGAVSGKGKDNRGAVRNSGDPLYPYFYYRPALQPKAQRVIQLVYTPPAKDSPLFKEHLEDLGYFDTGDSREEREEKFEKCGKHLLMRNIPEGNVKDGGTILDPYLYVPDGVEIQAEDGTDALYSTNRTTDRDNPLYGVTTPLSSTAWAEGRDFRNFADEFPTLQNVRAIYIGEEPPQAGTSQTLLPEHYIDETSTKSDLYKALGGGQFDGILVGTPAGQTYEKRIVQRGWRISLNITSAIIVALVIWFAITSIAKTMTSSESKSWAQGVTLRDFLARLALAVIAAGTSLWWPALLIDLSDSISRYVAFSTGYDPGQIIGVILYILTKSGVGGVSTEAVGWSGGAGELLSWATQFLYMLVIVTMLVFFALVIIQIIMRIVVINVLLMIAPVAMVLWALPSTEGFPKKWLNYFMLTLFQHSIQLMGFALGLAIINASVAGTNPFGRLLDMLIGVMAIYVVYKIPSMLGIGNLYESFVSTTFFALSTAQKVAQMAPAALAGGPVGAGLAGLGSGAIGGAMGGGGAGGILKGMAQGLMSGAKTGANMMGGGMGMDPAGKIPGPLGAMAKATGNAFRSQGESGGG